MDRKILGFLSATVVALLWSGCESRYGFIAGGSGMTSTFTYTDGGDIQVGEITPVLNPDDPGGVDINNPDDPDGPATTPTPYPDDSPAPPGGKPPGGDDPGDDPPPGGGGDPVSGCFTMRVITHGVSSARISLNDEEIFDPSDFHNRDLVLERDISLKDGENLLTMLVAGSPGDTLRVQIWDCAKDPAELLFQKELIRTTGKPNSFSGDI